MHIVSPQNDLTHIYGHWYCRSGPQIRPTHCEYRYLLVINTRPVHPGIFFCRFPETREMSSRVEGNIEDRGDGFPNNSLVLVEQGCILYTVYSTSISDSICEEGEHGINSFNFVLFGRLLGVLFQTFHIYWFSVPLFQDSRFIGADN